MPNDNFANPTISPIKNNPLQVIVTKTLRKLKIKKKLFKTMSKRLISCKDALVLQKLNRNNNPTHFFF